MQLIYNTDQQHICLYVVINFFRCFRFPFSVTALAFFSSQIILFNIWSLEKNIFIAYTHVLAETHLLRENALTRKSDLNLKVSWLDVSTALEILIFSRIVEYTVTNDITQQFF